MLRYVKAFTRNELDLALVNFNTLVTSSYILNINKRFKRFLFIANDVNLIVKHN